MEQQFGVLVSKSPMMSNLTANTELSCILAMADKLIGSHLEKSDLLYCSFRKVLPGYNGDILKGMSV